MEKYFENYVNSSVSDKRVDSIFKDYNESVFVNLVNYLCKVYEEHTDELHIEDVFDSVNGINLEPLNNLTINVASLFYEDIIMSAVNLKFYILHYKNKIWDDSNSIPNSKMHIRYITGKDDFYDSIKDDLTLYSSYLQVSIWGYKCVTAEVFDFLESTLFMSFISYHEFCNLAAMYANLHNLNQDEFVCLTVSAIIRGIWDYYNVEKPQYSFTKVIKKVIKEIIKNEGIGTTC